MLQLLPFWKNSLTVPLDHGILFFRLRSYLSIRYLAAPVVKAHPHLLAFPYQCLGTIFWRNVYLWTFHRFPLDGPRIPLPGQTVDLSLTFGGVSVDSSFLLCSYWNNSPKAVSLFEDEVQLWVVQEVLEVNGWHEGLARIKTKELPGCVSSTRARYFASAKTKTFSLFLNTNASFSNLYLLHCFEKALWALQW